MSEIFVVPKLLVNFPGMPGLLQCACEHAASRNEGMTVSQFLGEAGDAELHELLSLCLAAQQDPELLQAMAIFCALLALSEGMVVQDTDPLGEFVTRLAMMTQAETLSRSGLLALDLTTLTMEAFDVQAVPKTKAGQNANITVVKILPQ